ALTLPAVLLAYEWIYHASPTTGATPRAFRAQLSAWLRGPGSPVLLAIVLALLDLYGKVFGVDALTGMEGYRPVFTWHRFIDYQKTFLGDAVFWHTGGGGVLAFW